MAADRSQGKILIIRGGAIGDFILTLPALAALRAQFPDTHLALLGYRHIAELAHAADLVDEVRSIESQALAGFFAKGGRLDEALADFFSEFNVVCSYLYDPDLIFQTNLSRVSPAQFIAGPHRPRDADNVHASQVFLQPLQRLAIFDASPIPTLPVSLTASQPLLPAGQWLAVHPGSGSEKKNWPMENWAQLLYNLVQTTQINLFISGGEAEGDKLANLLSQLPADRIRVARSLPLIELAQWLRQCHAYIGHDSGISHLAAAVGLRSLLLWGHTNATVWAPPNPNSRLILAPREDLRQLPVPRVQREISALFASAL